MFKIKFPSYLCTQMTKSLRTNAQDLTTEQKVKAAAAKVFQQKGFAATRTRDIAEEAGLNLALINYYFRSKRNLFDMIMAEKLSAFFRDFIPLVMANDLSIDDKIQLISKNYITLLLDNPDLPIFIINAIHTNPEKFAKMVHGAELIQYSPLVAQLKKVNPKASFEHFFMNIIALCVFPFIVRSGISEVSADIGKNFEKLMKERIRLIPKWMDAMIAAK